MVEQLKKCFVIGPIGEKSGEIRRRSDQVFRLIIAKACAACGYEPIRADQITAPGMITADITRHLLDDDLVIADLTTLNPNVFYELGIRHCSNKPAILIIDEAESLPFDLSNNRIIFFKSGDADSIENCREQLEQFIRKSGELPQDTNLVTMVEALKSFYAIKNYLDNQILPLEIVEETYDENSAGEFTDKVYRRLWQEVDTVKHSLKAMSIAVLGDASPEGFLDRPFRNIYLNNLNNKILQRASLGYLNYSRIYQVAEGQDASSINPAALKHCREVVEIKNGLGSKKKNLTFEAKYLPSMRLTGFMLIDDNKLILMISGVSKQMGGYMHGLLIINDRTPKGVDVIQSHHDRFAYLQDIAQDISFL